MPRVIYPNWSALEIETLRLAFPSAPTRVIARVIGRPHHAVHNKAKELGLSKTREYMANRPIAPAHRELARVAAMLKDVRQSRGEQI